MTGRVVFFWDFDAQWGADRSRAPGGAKSWGNQEFINTQRLLELLTEVQIKACFAIVGAVALPGDRPYHDPLLVRRISESGHEIASHGFKHEWLPGLGREKLGQMLRESKDTLEQCIGKAVTTFVPPYNQPFDYLSRGSISLTERRIAGKLRVDIPEMCRVLCENGYRVTRVSYAKPLERLLEMMNLRSKVAFAEITQIHGVKAIKLSCRSGFGVEVQEALDRAVMNDRVLALYGHPHSLTGNGSQSENNLISILNRVTYWRERSRLLVRCPENL